MELSMEGAWLLRPESGERMGNTALELCWLWSELPPLQRTDAALAVRRSQHAGAENAMLTKAEGRFSANSWLIYFRGAVSRGMGNCLV